MTGWFARRYGALTEWVDRRFGWHRLPLPLGLAVLVGVRDTLRRENLHDAGGRPAAAPFMAAYTTRRTADGAWNDLDDGAMGMAGARFGRNIPIGAVLTGDARDVLTPNPRTVSRALLTRHEFRPAPTFNVLAASWIQFMVRDWFTHGHGPASSAWSVPLASDDAWPGGELTIPRVLGDANLHSHWWDGSMLYGNSAAEQRAARTGVDGKLRVGPMRPVVDGHDPTREPGFWLGLLMLHDLFAREHNAICDRLRGEHPGWLDEELFQRARLILAALLAKIHTIEWTPAMINHPTTVTAMRANWFGLAGERVRRRFGRISSSEAISGIIGSATDHFGVPFTLTEEFVAVYRMHPLMPDDFAVRAAADDAAVGSWTLRELSGPAALAVAASTRMADLFYSFGTAHPGALVLDNFPRHLQEFERPDGRLVDLAATDLVRIRELGVPRYNAFRRLMHLEPVESYAELTGDAALAARLRAVYGDDVESLDLMVGMFAERPPRGFAFSDTAFRVFVLMASRRLNSDRFFTRDYTPEVYTRVGLDWVADNTMTTVLLRHHPELRPALRAVANAFQPWRRTDN
ncbi:peroxidase family protein [Asanoa siamensis]|uniref:Peroxidase n=1 Tax=Asanoa siamensis TaxID=926357 RepID=A0ABQ4CRN6_9ACTN|nr:peroxidase family protein [Asanoa siamensis]GIF73949.1 putative peroxidase [Asanoa siamensis]